MQTNAVAWNYQRTTEESAVSTGTVKSKHGSQESLTRVQVKIGKLKLSVIFNSSIYPGRNEKYC